MCFFFSSRRRHTRYIGDWSSDVCSSDLFTQGGQRFRLRERGLPGVSGKRGDLYVVVQISMPRKLTEREREIWSELAKQIGRASCRERVESAGVGGAWKKNRRKRG